MAARVCWHCEAFAHHEPAGDPYERADGVWMEPLRCAACGALSLAVLYVGASSSRDASMAITHGATGETITWLPVKATGHNYPDVPPHIASAASEAHTCHSVDAHRAAALMARAVIEAVAKEHGITNGSLYSKIDELRKRELVTELVRHQAHEIREFGNEMAHGDFIEDIGPEIAAEIIGIMGKILGSVYQDPAQLKALRDARIARQQPRQSPAPRTEP